MGCRWCEKKETAHAKDCPNFGEVKDSWSSPEARHMNENSRTTMREYKRVSKGNGLWDRRKNG